VRSSRQTEKDQGLRKELERELPMSPLLADDFSPHPSSHATQDCNERHRRSLQESNALRRACRLVRSARRWKVVLLQSYVKDDIVHYVQDQLDGADISGPISTDARLKEEV